MVKSYLELHFTDLAGVLRSTMISVESKILENSDIDDIYVLFDASSVYGFEKIENSDLVLKPVKYTLSRIPWTIDLYRVIAQVYRSHNERYVKDPRLVAEKLIDYTHSMGYIPYTGVEMEFFIFDKLSYNVT
ncbi:MAG: type I glutamate--ammonia ligase, partial [Thermoprotei archaeon]